MMTRSTRRLLAVLATVVLTWTLVGAHAPAAEKPVITERPSISGIPAVGETLQATAQWTGPSDTTATWTWQRCPVDGLSDCDAVGSGQSYVVQADDVGSLLRVRLRLQSDGTTMGYSDLVGPVLATAPEPPAPEPTPTATPDPGATPDPSATPTPEPTPGAIPSTTPTQTSGAAQPIGSSFVSGPGTAPTVVDTPPAIAPPTLLRGLSPFPVVRIRGILTANGARITLFTVRGPRGARIAVRCRGRSCPRAVWRRRAVTRVTRVRPFERRLQLRTRLVVIVSARGRVGKHSTFVIRRGKAPLRLDRCVLPGSTRAVRCPRRLLP